MKTEQNSNGFSWWGIVKEQTARGNMIPLIATIIASYLVWEYAARPFYEDAKSWYQVALYGATKSTEVSVDVEKLQKEIRLLKSDLERQRAGMTLGEPFQLVIKR